MTPLSLYTAALATLLFIVGLAAFAFDRGGESRTGAALACVGLIGLTVLAGLTIR